MGTPTLTGGGSAVVAASAEANVGVGAAVEAVDAREAAEEGVVARLAEQAVVAFHIEQKIVAGTAPQDVVARSTEEDVVAGAIDSNRISALLARWASMWSERVSLTTRAASWRRSIASKDGTYHELLLRRWRRGA